MAVLADCGRNLDGLAAGWAFPGRTGKGDDILTAELAGVVFALFVGRQNSRAAALRADKKEIRFGWHFVHWLGRCLRH